MILFRNEKGCILHMETSIDCRIFCRVVLFQENPEYIAMNSKSFLGLNIRLFWISNQYIQIFVQIFDTNIFGYSFASKFYFCHTLVPDNVIGPTLWVTPKKYRVGVLLMKSKFNLANHNLSTRARCMVGCNENERQHEIKAKRGVGMVEHALTIGGHGMVWPLPSFGELSSSTFSSLIGELRAKKLS